MPASKSKKSVTYVNVDLVGASTEGRGHFYHTRVPTKGEKAGVMKLKLRKYNKFTRTHMEFVQQRQSKAKAK